MTITNEKAEICYASEREREHGEQALFRYRGKIRTLTVSVYINPISLVPDEYVLSVFVHWYEGEFIGLEEDLKMEPDGLYRLSVEHRFDLLQAFSQHLADIRHMVNQHVQRISGKNSSL